MKIRLILAFAILLMLIFCLSACSCEHEFGDWQTIKDADCENAGEQKHVCDKCGLEETQQIPPTHVFISKTNSPTCTEDGISKKVCALCGFEEILEQSPALGHHFEEVTSDGQTNMVCSHCKQIEKQPEPEPVEHNFEKVKTVKATCKAEGYTLQICSKCGEESKTDIKPKTSHSYITSNAMYATYKSAGSITLKCKNCSSQQSTKLDTIKTITVSGATIKAKGVDLSKHNSEQSGGKYQPFAHFDKIKAAGFSYVILRAGSTNLKEDPVFDANYKAAKAAGLDVGAYFYTYATTSAQIKTDANLFVEICKGKTFEYPLYMDLEEATIRSSCTGATATKFAFEFIEILQKNGFYGALYCYHDWMENYLNKSELMGSFDIWMARYPTSGTSNWSTVWGSAKPYSMWQHTDKGTISGISGKVFDFNVCYVDYPTRIKELGLNGFPLKSTTTNETPPESTPTETKEYVWIICNSLNIRDNPVLASGNILGVANNGDKFEVLEKASTYTKIKYNDGVAYISAKPEYVSFTAPT